MIKTGRRSGADDSATISTHCVTGTNGRSLRTPKTTITITVGEKSIKIDYVNPPSSAELVEQVKILASD